MTWRISESNPVTEQYCIYWDPSDYPKRFVVRRWSINEDGEPIPDPECIVRTRLTGARKVIPPGFVRIGRDKRDDKTIVEVWI